MSTAPRCGYNEKYHQDRHYWSWA